MLAQIKLRAVHRHVNCPISTVYVITTCTNCAGYISIYQANDGEHKAIVADKLQFRKRKKTGL
jgi:hypothetical protein